MQDNKNNNKKEKDPSLLDTIKQINYQEELKRQERFEKLNEAEREEYGKKNAEEKVEVIKVRQGVSDGEDLLSEEELKKNYTFSQKVGNFFYHNKWWLGITSFLVIIAGFLIYDFATTVRPDVRIMFLSINGDVYSKNIQINDYLNSLVKDYNDDGRKQVDIVYIPVSMEIQDTNAYQNSLTALSNQFQLGETMLVLGDAAVDEFIGPDTTLEDLSVYFPNDTHVNGSKYMLKGSGFAKKIGMKDEDIPNDLYLGIRRLPESNLSSEETNKENHANAVETLKALVRDLGHK